MQNGKMTIRNDNEKKQNFCRELRIGMVYLHFDTITLLFCDCDIFNL